MTTRRPYLEERFWALVARRSSTGCWLWLGAVHRTGSGQYGNRQAARIAWELTIGPIARGLEIAHRCGVKRCCNPDHMELITHLESQLRSPLTFAAINRAKTHCPRGHDYDYRTPNGSRRCRACQRRRDASPANPEFPLAAPGTAVPSADSAAALSTGLGRISFPLPPQPQPSSIDQQMR